MPKKILMGETIVVSQVLKATPGGGTFQPVARANWPLFRLAWVPQRIGGPEGPGQQNGPFQRGFHDLGLCFSCFLRGLVKSGMGPKGPMGGIWAQKIFEKKLGIPFPPKKNVTYFLIGGEKKGPFGIFFPTPFRGDFLKLD